MRERTIRRGGVQLALDASSGRADRGRQASAAALRVHCKSCGEFSAPHSESIRRGDGDRYILTLRCQICGAFDDRTLPAGD